MTRGVPEKVWDIMVGKIPVGRAGTAADVGNMVAFLLPMRPLLH
jgi:3-oxoacyl-[acyl-carrier protein] reductase/2-hydroxycyclohexanecarboxyl-CoA dehydrogenase